MRKLELRAVSQISPVAAEMEETPAGVTETRAFEAADGRRLFIIVLKSDSVTEQQLLNLKQDLGQKFKGVGDVALLTMGAEDSFEIYEVDESPTSETQKSD